MNQITSNVIAAYLSRHVELSGDLPPLRSLPYGRLGDIWRSNDLGTHWKLVSDNAPWGRRAFFGAVPIRGGQSLLVLGGVRDPDDTGEGASVGPPTALGREYTNDVWWADINGDSVNWHELQRASWKARAAFQANLRSGREEEVVVLGGRLADGILSSDVWVASVQETGMALGEWRQLTTAAGWVPRSDFAATVRGQSELWVLGGCDQAGRALMDVWRSSDGHVWNEVLKAAPWGPRIGPAAVVLDTPGNAAESPIVLFGGFANQDSAHSSIPPSVGDAPAASWAAAGWASHDGVHWQAINITRMLWSPNAMHSALISAPCGRNSTGVCAYAAGGLTHEGYYDNTAYRLLMPANLRSNLEKGAINDTQAPLDDDRPSTPQLDWMERKPEIAGAIALTFAAFCFLRYSNCKPTNGVKSQPPLDPVVHRVLVLLVGICIICIILVGFGWFALSRLSQELQELRTEGSKCRVDADSADSLLDTLGLRKVADRWDNFETLLRVASKEPQLGYGSLGGGYGGGYGGGLGGYGKGKDLYGAYDRYDMGGYGGGMDRFGGYGGLGDEMGSRDSESGSKSGLSRELAMLPTTQGLSCRSPRCDRNATACKIGSTERSLTAPYGCCTDYMAIMLGDVSQWLAQQEIPYFVTYGTLLGALRDNDILPWTQDMDIVIDRKYWPQVQRGLEAMEFFGGRRYLFGVDQWEERVSRVCADWEGFAASTIGGPDGDRLSRGTEFHLDIYASDWWQITDMHLIDCVEPLGTTMLSVRGQNVSAPARPRACVEKLYGAEWRTPKPASSGVN